MNFYQPAKQQGKTYGLQKMKVDKTVEQTLDKMPYKQQVLMCRNEALLALKSAAFEERVNKNREAADWWRERSVMWLRRLHQITYIEFFPSYTSGVIPKDPWLKYWFVTE